MNRSVGLHFIAVCPAVRLFDGLHFIIGRQIAPLSDGFYRQSLSIRLSRRAALFVEEAVGKAGAIVVFLRAVIIGNIQFIGTV